MDFQLVDHAVVRKDHDVGMSRSNEEMFDVIAALGRSPKSSFASASLALVSRNWGALDVAAVRNRDRYIFVSNQIFD